MQIMFLTMYVTGTMMIMVAADLETEILVMIAEEVMIVEVMIVEEVEVVMTVVIVVTVGVDMAGIGKIMTDLEAVVDMETAETIDMVTEVVWMIVTGNNQQSAKVLVVFSPQNKPRRHLLFQRLLLSPEKMRMLQGSESNAKNARLPRKLKQKRRPSRKLLRVKLLQRKRLQKRQLRLHRWKWIYWKPLHLVTNLVMTSRVGVRSSQRYYLR
mmetsp:Transcript_7529/g.8737  ORF Transcript_7529/g.8737 Transcript_7529/m.8737 type:complete len:212 (-) Transcript_7529:712-1347(-)